MERYNRPIREHRGSAGRVGDGATAMRTGTALVLLAVAGFAWGFQDGVWAGVFTALLLPAVWGLLALFFKKWMDWISPPRSTEEAD